MWIAARPSTPSLAKNVVYSLSPRAITDVLVEGKPIVRDRALVNLRLDDIGELVRKLTRDWTRD